MKLKSKYFDTSKSVVGKYFDSFLVTQIVKVKNITKDKKKRFCNNN